MTTPTVMGPRIVVVDSQRLNNIQLCMRKYRLIFGDSISPIIRPAYFERGDMLHQMLQAYYVLRKYRTRWAQNRTDHKRVQEICVNIGRHAAIRMNLEIEDVEEVIDAFLQYSTHYENDGWDQILAIEQVGSKILYQSDALIILYEFKIDLTIRLANCPVMPVDHKSSRKRTPPETLSNQFMGYCWGLGVNNIMVNKIGFQKTLKPEEKFQRYTLSYSNDVLDEWRESAIWWVKHALNQMDEGLFPPNLTSCDKWGGCVFQELCVCDRVTREYKMKTKFEQVPIWDPGKHL